MFREKMKGFLAGVCVTALLAGTATVFAKNVDVAMGGIKVYWDGVEQTLRNAKGDKVEPLIYEGTTYVPLRALAGLLGKDVDWEQNTQSVYIGEKPTAETTPLDKMPKDKFQYGYDYIRTGEKAKFNLKDKEIKCSNMLYGENALVILNGEYSKLVGKAVSPYTSVGSHATNELAFYSVENDGTETEIASYELTQTEDPIDININLKGVQNLRIKFGHVAMTVGSNPHGYTANEDVALYDVSLLGN